MAEDIARLGLEVDSKQVKTAIRELDRLEGQSGKTEKATKKMSKSFVGLGSAIGAIGVGLLAKNIITANAEFSKLSGALETVTGSTEAADAALGMLKGLMVEVPGSLNELTNSFIKLTALGLDPSEEALVSYSNTAAAMGHSLNQMIEAVADAATGEFERLKEFGIKAASEGDRVKFTFQGVTTEIGKNAEEIQDFLLGIGNVQFADAAADQMNTFGGAIDNLQSQFSLLLIGGKGTLNDATEQLKDLSDLVGSDDTQKAFGALTAAVISLVGLAAKGAVAFADFGKAIGDFAGDIATTDVNEEIVILEQTIVRLKSSIKDVGSFEGWLWSGKDRDELEDDLLRVETRLGVLKSLSSEMAEQEAIITPPSEEVAITPAAIVPVDGDGAIDPLEALLDQAIADEEELAMMSEQADAKLAIQQDYWDRLFNMETGSQEASLRFADAIRTKDLQGALKTGALALSNVSKQSRAMFNVQKALALANAAVNLPDAILQSFKHGGGYPLGLIPAAAMAAAGAAQISSIASASFGGGGGGTPSVGGGASTSALPPGATATPTGLEEDIPAPRELSVTFPDDSIHSDAMRQFLAGLNEVAEDMGGFDKVTFG